MMEAINILLTILAVLIIPLLGFMVKLAYDYGSLKTMTQNILSKVDDLIRSNEKDYDKLSDDVKENTDAIAEIRVQIQDIVSTCKTIHKGD